MTIFNSFLNGLVDMINFFVSLLFTPIDYILNAVLPSWESISTNIVGFLNYFYQDFLFFLNWIHIPSAVYELILGYITFRVAIFLGTLGFKIFIKWYNALKV